MNEDEDARRLFDPYSESWYSHIARTKPSQLLKYNEEKQFNQLQGSNVYRRNEISLQDMTLVVHIDGACRNNGKADARAAFGVYFGPNSKYNTFGLLDSSLPQTSNRAEIEALVQAIKVLKLITANDIKVQDIKIATDSEYLANAIALWMDGWKEDGGVKSNGEPVAHFEVLEEICSTLDEMEFGDDGGIECQMWRIGRDENAAADLLANSAFN
jgi:ribonuclease HI